MSLRRRTRRTFVGFSIAVALLFAASGLGVLDVTEDALLERQLEMELTRLATQLPSDPVPSPGFSVYLGDAQLPPELHALRGAGAGFHEADVGERDFMVLVGERGDARVFVLRDVSALEPSNLPIGRSASWLVCALAAAIAALGSALGFLTARRIARPLHELAVAIEQTPADLLHEALDRDEHDEEVAFLVGELRARVLQLREFAAREEQFTRYASHELRNPVAVIKGAAELLNHVADDDPKVRRPLERIERAVADMEAIVECFLWLARARRQDVVVEAADLRPIVDAVVARYQHILADKDVVIEVDGDGTIAAPPDVLEIAIGNLVANAFHYTRSGEVTVSLSDDSINVADTGPGLGDEADELARSYVRGSESGGHGLGLAIVQSICNRFDWELDLGSRAEGGTVATLRFS